MNKYLLLSIILFFLSITIINANAESGTVSISDIDSKTNYSTGLNGWSVSQPDWDALHFLNSSYNHIDYLVIHGRGHINYNGYTGELSEFTCTSGGTCSGIVSFNAAQDKIEWVFYEASITSNHVNLSYTSSVLDLVTVYSSGIGNGVEFDTVPGNINSTSPVAINGEHGNWNYLLMGGFQNPAHGFYYEADVGVSTSVAYTITYPVIGKFQWLINKAGSTVQTRATLYGLNNVNYSTEPYDNTNFSGISNYTNGLLLNVSLANGAYVNTLINNTVLGSGVSSVTPTGSLSYMSSGYQIGEFGIVYADTTNVNFTTDTLWVNYYDPTGKLYASEKLSSDPGGSSWTQPFAFDKSGRWTAVLETCDNGSCSSGGWSLDTAYVDVTGLSSVGSFAFWDKTNYSLGEESMLSWGFSDADWTYYELQPFHKRQIEVYKDSVLYSVLKDVDQFSSHVFYFPEKGFYEAQAVYCGSLVCQTAAKSVMKVVEPFYEIVAPPSVNEGQTFTINFYAGSTITSGLISDNIDLMTSPKFITLSCPCTGWSSTTYNISSPGLHRLSLWNSTSSKILAYTDIRVNAVSGGSELRGNFTTSSIETDLNTYSMADTIYGSYRIDNTNYSLYSKYIIQLKSQGNIPMNMKLLDNPSDFGQFALPVDSGSYSLLSDGTAYITLSGTNSALYASRVELANKTLSILAKRDGYSIRVLPKLLCSYGNVYVNYNATASSLLYYKYKSAAGNLMEKTQNISSGNNTVILTFEKGTILSPSGMVFEIRTTSGEMKVTSAIEFHADGCTATGYNAPGDYIPPPSPSSSSGSWEDQYGDQDMMSNLKNWIKSNLGSSPATMFVSGVIIIIFLTALMMGITKKPVGGVFGGLLGIGVNLSLEVWELVWAVMILVIVAFLVMGMIKKG